MTRDTTTPAALPQRIPQASAMPTPTRPVLAECDLAVLRRVREALITLPSPEQLRLPRTNEFATLDLDELDDAPLRAAIPLATLERADLPRILAISLPSLVHARRHNPNDVEHQFIDTATGAAVRYLSYADAHGRLCADIAEFGPAGLFDRIVLACLDWA